MALSNPLESFPVVRQWAYRVYWLVGIAVTATQVGYVTATGTSPSWITVALAVLAYVGIALGFQADRNVDTSYIPQHAAGD